MKWLGLILFTYISVNAEVQLEFLGDFTTPQNTIFNKTLIGGLSGVAFDKNQIWAVSDDRGQNNEPRIYTFDYEITSQSFINSRSRDLSSTTLPLGFRINPNAVIFLKAPSDGVGSRNLLLDSEGIIRFKQGWLVSTEGDYHKIPRLSPSLKYFDYKGTLLKSINWPKKYLPNPTGKQVIGIRSNLAFEALSASPDGAYLFAAHEAPLVQENRNWKTGEAGGINIIRFNVPNSGDQIIVDKEYKYQLDKYKKEQAKIIGSGVSEILALSSNIILVLERASYFDSVNLLSHEAKIYEVNLNVPKDKKLVFDLENLKNLLKTTKNLDNFEGMALGPVYDNDQTVIMVSDDNFNPLENTMWLLFRLKMEK
jgi:hypothetical protein